MSLRLTILGCGSSAGVPRPALGWGACDPNEPKNRRRRCSVLFEQVAPQGVTRVLIDTSPDLREQLLDANVERLDAVFLTHEHADQTHGMDDLRSLFHAQRSRIPTYLNDETARDVMTRFAYCFDTPDGSDYPPILRREPVEAGDIVAIAGPGGVLPVRAFALRHGNIGALGYRVGDVAYTPDVSDIPAESLSALDGLDLWVIDALRYTPHPSHFHIEAALDWIARMQPRRAILTNMNADVDYTRVSSELPGHVVAGFDGMMVTTAKLK